MFTFVIIVFIIPPMILAVTRERHRRWVWIAGGIATYLLVEVSVGAVFVTSLQLAELVFDFRDERLERLRWVLYKGGAVVGILAVYLICRRLAGNESENPSPPPAPPDFNEIDS